MWMNMNDDWKWHTFLREPCQIVPSDHFLPSIFNKSGHELFDMN